MWIYSMQWSPEHGEWMYADDVYEHDFGTDFNMGDRLMTHVFIAGDKLMMYAFKEKDHAIAFKYGLHEGLFASSRPEELYETYLNKYINMGLAGDQTKFTDGDVDGFLIDGDDWDKY